MTTVSDNPYVREEGKAVEATALPESLPGQARTCASSVPLPAATALAPVTERARAVAAVAVRAGAKAAELADRPGSLVHAQPPTFVQARVRHHERARKHQAPALRYPLLVYGYMHLVLVKSALNFLEWVTETPLRAAAAAVLILLVYFWS